MCTDSLYCTIWGGTVWCVNLKKNLSTSVQTLDLYLRSLRICLKYGSKHPKLHIFSSENIQRKTLKYKGEMWPVSLSLFPQ
jgi:hypothetical protein